MTTVLVIGDGRMGTIIRELVEADESLELAGIIGIDNKDELADAAPAADVAIDFSHKSMLDLVEAYVNRTGAALVSGTTGYDEAEMGRIRALGEKAPVIHSANYSLGVAVLRRLAAEAAKALPGFDIEIVETHHNQKVDAPSGTAITLAEEIISDVDRKKEWVKGVQRLADGSVEGSNDVAAVQLAIESIRRDEVPGIHSVVYDSDADCITITHDAHSRKGFAMGAVLAAEYTKDHSGLLTISDMFKF